MDKTVVSNQVKVTRTPGEQCEVGLTFRFSPGELGKEKEQAIWQSLGQLLAELLQTPEERAEFLRQFEAAKNG